MALKRQSAEEFECVADIKRSPNAKIHGVVNWCFANEEV